MYAEYPLTLPGGFVLPVTLCVEVYTSTEQTLREPADQGESLSEFAREYLGQQMISGTIRNYRETITTDGSLARLTGQYVCTELISKGQQEQIGELHGKTD